MQVLDQDYALRDDFFTTPFGHPSYGEFPFDISAQLSVTIPESHLDRFFCFSHSGWRPSRQAQVRRTMLWRSELLGLQ